MDDKFDEWIRVLDEEVIQGEFGYEEGEFTVYPSHWRHMFVEGLTPRQAWQRAMDAHKAARDEEDARKLANYRRIVAADAAAIAGIPRHGQMERIVSAATTAAKLKG